MGRIKKHLTWFIASVWFINGFVCKVLNLVPRHQDIVSRILGNSHSRLLTDFIGVAEVGMAFWIITGISPRLNAVVQIMVIATMNVLEFFLVPDLLLWGNANAFFAFVFILVIYYNEFVLYRKFTFRN